MASNLGVDETWGVHGFTKDWPFGLPALGRLRNRPQLASVSKRAWCSQVFLLERFCGLGAAALRARSVAVKLFGSRHEETPIRQPLAKALNLLIKEQHGLGLAT